MDPQTLERISKGLRDSSLGPETIALMLTGACNLNCVYCRGGRKSPAYKAHSKLKGELTTKELFRLFEGARGLKVKEINLGGMDGEPFCRRDIFAIMRKIKQLGFMGSMTTNGSLLSRKAAEIISDCGWDILLLSFDSSEASILHSLRPARNHKPYFDNIIKFLDVLHTEGGKVRVLVNVVINKLNYRGLPELVKFANYYKNIESINILKLLNMGLLNYSLLQLDNGELKEFRSILSGLKGEKKLLYFGNWLGPCDEAAGLIPDKPKNETAGVLNKCFTNYYIISINSNGDVIKCPQYPERIEGLNIRELPLQELWRNQHLRFRQNLYENAHCFESCCTILKEQNKLIYKNLSPSDDGK